MLLNISEATEIPIQTDLGYDANGNTLSDTQGRSFTSDFENRPTQVVNPGVGTTTFKYDPFGRRIQKAGPLGTTNYLYDGANLLEELDSSGSVIARYTANRKVDQPLAMLRNTATSYYHADGLGSITSLSSAAGALANTYTYDSFGNLTASTGTLVNPFQYTARDFDSEIGVRYYRARYYDQNAGRFLSEDPLQSPIELNLYKYVRSNPVNRIDSSGLMSHAYHGCTLVSTLKMLLWTSESGQIPQGDWYFDHSIQEHAERDVPWVVVDCLWYRNYTAERWGHYLVTETWKCFSYYGCFGPNYHTWTEHRFHFSAEDLGRTTGREPRVTQWIYEPGAEDETNDILCLINPGLRP